MLESVFLKINIRKNLVFRESTPQGWYDIILGKKEIGSLKINENEVQLKLDREFNISKKNNYKFLTKEDAFEFCCSELKSYFLEFFN